MRGGCYSCSRLRQAYGAAGPASAKPAARQAVLGLDGVRGEGTDRTYGTYTTYMIYERGGSILGAGGCGASAAPVTFGFEDEDDWRSSKRFLS